MSVLVGKVGNNIRIWIHGILRYNMVKVYHLNAFLNNLI